MKTIDIGNVQQKDIANRGKGHLDADMGMGLNEYDITCSGHCAWRHGF